MTENGRLIKEIKRLETMIELRGIDKRFGKKEVLKGFSGSFSYGKWTLITGPSGCGKTTLFRILLGLEEADAGTISGLPKKCSAVFQENRLCEGFSVMENLRLVSNASDERITEILQFLSLDSCKVQTVSELSGGMKRRIAIARAVLAERDLYLLDEPFYGLDEKIKIKTMDFLIKYLESKTVIVITHDKEAVEYLKTKGIIASEIMLEMQ